MTLSHLVACAACARHVRADEPTCPFCEATTHDARRVESPRPFASARGRAGLVAFGFATVGVACSGSSASSLPPYGAAPDAAEFVTPDEGGADDDASFDGGLPTRDAAKD